MVRSFFHIVLIFILYGQLSAQRLSHKQYTSENGLTQTETGAAMVLYDSTIYVFEVSNQMKKFDGYQFQNCENDFIKACCIHGFVNSTNYSIIMDDLNFSIYQNGVFHKLKPPFDSYVAQDNKGIFLANDTIWLATTKGLFYVDVTAREMKKSEVDQTLADFLQASDIIYYWESKNRELKLYHNDIGSNIKDKDGNSINLNPLKINGLWKDHFKTPPYDLRFFSAKFPNLRSFDGKSNVLHINQGNNKSVLVELFEEDLEVRGIIGAREGSLTKVSDQCYLDGGHEGFFRINPNIHFFHSGDEMIPALHSIMSDHSNSILLGSYGYGYSYFRKYELHKSDQYSDSKVMPGALSHTNGKMYTFEDAPIPGLFEMHFDQKNGLVKKRILNHTGYVLKELKDHSIAAGSLNNTLFLIDPVCDGIDKNMKKIDAIKGLKMNNVLGIEEDEKGRLWLMGAGIAIYDRAKDTIITYKKPKENAAYLGGYSLKLDHKGTMWFGSNKGVFYLKNASSYNPSGLDIFEKCKKLELPNGEQTTITFTTKVDSFLILGSFTSVSFIDLPSFYKNPENPIIYQLIYGEDLEGGGSEQNAILLDKDRRLWIGSQDGATMIDWDRFRFDDTKCKIAIHQLIVGNDTIPVNRQFQEINIPFDKRNMHINFGLEKNISLLKNVFFDYHLVNENGDTIISKKYDQNGELAMDYLSPGNYTLIILANKHGQKMDEVRMSIHAPMALSENPWFWSGLGLSLLALFTTLFAYRNNLKNQKLSTALLMIQLNADKEQLQVQSIISSFNPHFINNSLHWIQSKHINDEDTVNLVGNLSENIRHIFECTTLGKAAHTLGEELKLVDNYVAVQMVRFNHSFIYIPPSPEDVSPLSDFLVLLMQLQIHVENAIEHGLRNRLTSSYVKVSIEEKADLVLLKVEDDGAGRRQAKSIGSLGTQQGTKMLEELHKIFNQNNQNHIKHSYEDDIFESNGEKFGTRITISIPKDYIFLLKHN